MDFLNLILDLFSSFPIVEIILDLALDKVINWEMDELDFIKVIFFDF